MHEILEFLKQLTNPESIIKFGGLTLLLFVIFAETGLFIGFFLPGDSLVLISGIMCASRQELLNISIVALEISLMAAAILGNIAGYWFGHKMGEKLLFRKDSLLFKKKHIELTQQFYKKNGGKTLIIGRFLPIIRTFAPILAGIIKIDKKNFMLYNVVGAVLWIGLLSTIGYRFGRVPWVKHNIGYIIIGLIIITMLPIATLGYKKGRTK